MTENNEQYYLQNKSAGYLGNAPIWWNKGNRGYSAYIMSAKKWNKEAAEKMVKDDPKKWAMHKCSDVNKLLRLVVDHQDLAFPDMGDNTHDDPWYTYISEDDANRILGAPNT